MPKMRLGWYAGVSTALAGSVVLSAFHQRANFYSAMVYLAQSNFCLLVMVNFTLLLYSSFVYALTRLCFGRLRAVEVETLTERAWFAITETCLAMTIFRDEIGPWFLVMFTALVTGKVWGWIGDGRVEILEQQPPANPRLFHTRLTVSLTTSILYDLWLLRYTILTVIQYARPTIMVMFLFEFAVLTTCSWRTGARYLLSIAEQNIIQAQTKKQLLERRLEIRTQRENMIRQREQAAAAGETLENQEPLPSEEDVDEMDIEVPGWAAKGEWVLWLDLLSDMIKLGIYVAFFFMLLRLYGLPIHIMRDLFMTSRDFVKRLSALLRYRRAIKEMNQYPDATQEDLARENTCIICREEMHPWDDATQRGGIDRIRPKKLPCGHILHLGCLKSWLERQQVCPTCRTPVTGDRTRAAQNRGGQLRLDLDAGRGAGQGQGQGQQAPANNQAPQGDARGNDGAPPRRQRLENGARVFNLGPFRLGIGANDEQVRELAQQFGMNGQNNANDAPATTPAPVPLTGNNIQDILNLTGQAGQLLRREIDALSHSQQELTVIHLLLAELHRLRQRQMQQPDAATSAQSQSLLPPLLSANLPAFQQPPGQAFPQPAQSPFGPLPGMSNSAFAPQRVNSPIMARHGTTSTTSIPAGSPDLPDGVVLPPGWSLMPLQRLDASQDGGTASSQSVPPQSVAPWQPPSEPASSALQSTIPVPVPAPAPVTESGSDAARAVPETSQSTQPIPSENHPHPQSQSATTDSPASVVAPTSEIPNWGGSAQLFNRRQDTPETAPTPEAEPAVGTSSGVERAAMGHAGESKTEEKGKAKAVTVEDEDA